MTEPAPPSPDPLEAARKLGEEYAALLARREWQLDTPPGPAAADSADPDSAPPQAPAASPVPGFASAVSPPNATPAEGIPGTAPAGSSPDATPVPVAQPVNEPTSPPTPLQIIEALLFVGGPPVTLGDAQAAIRGLTPEDFLDTIEALNRLYQAQNRPYAIVPQPPGYVLRVHRRFAAIRDKLFGGPRETRLSQQALDVLALVAYRQPIAAAEIDSLRGQPSAAILRQLVRLGLIATHEHSQPQTGEPLFVTTPRFLEIFRLRSLDDLPQLGEPRQVTTF